MYQFQDAYFLKKNSQVFVFIIFFKKQVWFVPFLNLSVCWFGEIVWNGYQVCAMEHYLIVALESSLLGYK